MEIGQRGWSMGTAFLVRWPEEGHNWYAVVGRSAIRAGDHDWPGAGGKGRCRKLTHKRTAHADKKRQQITARRAATRRGPEIKYAYTRAEEAQEERDRCADER